MLVYYSLWVCSAGLVLCTFYFALTRYAPASVLHHLPWLSSSNSSSYLPLPASFAEQVRSGFSSTLFNVERDNIEGGDGRQGLDQRGLEEVRSIMSREGKTFDEARLIRQQRIFGRNGIDPMTGMPLDAKAITRL